MKVTTARKVLAIKDHLTVALTTMENHFERMGISARANAKEYLALYRDIKDLRKKHGDLFEKAYKARQEHWGRKI